MYHRVKILVPSLISASQNPWHTEKYSLLGINFVFNFFSSLVRNGFRLSQLRVELETPTEMQVGFMQSGT